MRHYPVFLDLRDRRVVVAGAGPVAVAKLRLLMKTEAEIVVYGPRPSAAVRAWAAERRIALFERELEAADAAGAALVYGATGDAAADARVAEIARAAGVLVNIVDNLEDSDFITPAIVDRDPVTVAIGTEGAAPVLARKIKAEIEALLPATLGGSPGSDRGSGTGSRRSIRGRAGCSGRGSISNAARGRWSPARMRRATSWNRCCTRASPPGAAWCIWSAPAPAIRS